MPHRDEWPAATARFFDATLVGVRQPAGSMVPLGSGLQAAGAAWRAVPAPEGDADNTTIGRSILKGPCVITCVTLLVVDAARSAHQYRRISNGCEESCSRTQVQLHCGRYAAGRTLKAVGRFRPVYNEKHFIKEADG
jgi:hypothetical protein